ncbi:MAG: hypothetical protein ACNA7V_13220 [Bacteroidales bacterium]
MKKKFSITVVIFFSAFMLSVSAMSIQQRYERRKEDSEPNPNVIELADQHIFKFLKNTWFYDLPLTIESRPEVCFFNDEMGFGNKHTMVFQPFLFCQLKFVLTEFIGFYEAKPAAKTLYSGHWFG